MSHRIAFIHALAEPTFWIAAVICIVAEISILRSAFMPHAESGESPSLPHSGRALELVWAILPAIVLALLLAATWRAVHH